VTIINDHNNLYSIWNSAHAYTTVPHNTSHKHIWINMYNMPIIANM
jgi:hypothetical protein